MWFCCARRFSMPKRIKQVFAFFGIAPILYRIIADYAYTTDAAFFLPHLQITRYKNYFGGALQAHATRDLYISILISVFGVILQLMVFCILPVFLRVKAFKKPITTLRALLLTIVCTTVNLIIYFTAWTILEADKYTPIQLYTYLHLFQASTIIILIPAYFLILWWKEPTQILSE